MGILLGGLADYAGFNCPEDLRHKEIHSVFKYDPQLSYPETALCICSRSDLPIHAPLILCCDPVDGMLCGDGTREIAEVFRICCDYLMHHAGIDEGCARLSSALLSGKGLSHIIDTAGRVFGNPIILSDQSFTIIGHSNAEDVSDPFLQAILRDGHYPQSYIRRSSRRAQVTSTSLDIVPPVQSEDFSPRNYMVMDLEVRGRYFGFATLVEESPFHEGDGAMFSYLCRILVTELKSVENTHHVHTRDSEYVLLELLDGKLHGGILQDRLLQSGLSFHPEKKRLFVIRSKGTTALQKPRYEFLIDAFFARLQKRPCVIYHDAIVCLVDSSDINLFTGDSSAGITDLLTASDLICGVSNEISDPGKTSACFHQAWNALNIAELLKDPGVYFFYEDYCFYELLDAVSPQERLSEFCSPKYLKMLRYDSANGTDYAETLSSYLRCGCDSMKAAAEMHVHRNTIIYRMKKIEEFFAINLDDSDELFSLNLTSRVIRFLSANGKDIISEQSPAAF